jgi:hypothetical protein
VKISTILDHIDSGHMALPEFQRGYVWNRDQVRGLMLSLYRRHPIGSLLVWVTRSDGAPTRGDAELAPGIIKLLLDGQQRMTSLYGIIRGRTPRFFDGRSDTFTGLYFNLETEEFSFYQPLRMKDDPLWVNVSDLMKGGMDGLGAHLARMGADPDRAADVGVFAGRLTRILGIQDVELHIEEVAGEDKTTDIVVDIFNRVNSGGTKLSKGDLALAKICADWPEARARMKETLKRWHGDGYTSFDLDWFLRNVNTILTGEARFLHLHNVSADRVQQGVERAEKHIDTMLNLVAGRLGLDHDRVLFGRYAFPVMTHYLERRGGHLSDQIERDRLLFWYLQSAMWGRFSGSTETVIDKDLHAIEDIDTGLDTLIRELCLAHGRLSVQPDHFSGWSLGARFYPVLYLLTRTSEAKDWGLGVPLKHGMHGKMSRLEVHHVFPKAQLYAAGFARPQVNAVANYCFQTKDTNLKISDRLPEHYFPEIEANFPGALESQWIPMDHSLWRIDRYLDFLEERKRLLADRANAILRDLYHEDLPTLAAPETTEPTAPPQVQIPGGIESADEEAQLNELNQWIAAQGLPEGQMAYELIHPDSGRPIAILDLAWPSGLQVGLSEPVAVLLNEGPELIKLANQQGYKFFTDVDRFKSYVENYVRPLADRLNGVVAQA